MITLNAFQHEELVDEAAAISSLAFTLQAALEGPQHSDYFTGASCILSEKLSTFVDTLKALDAGEGK